MPLHTQRGKLDADRSLFDTPNPQSSRPALIDNMLPYIEAQLAEGVRLHHITRHILGLFSGTAGARQWKRHISENAHKEGAGPEVLIGAMEKMNAARNAA